MNYIKTLFDVTIQKLKNYFGQTENIKKKKIGIIALRSIKTVYLLSKSLDKFMWKVNNALLLTHVFWWNTSHV